ncbi:MAG TPA: hypothetical protein VF473_11220, partial [Cyclobacteriaceae bacterium]
MTSPFICYLVSFLVVMLFYLLGWSALYPELDGRLVLFLLITAGLHFASNRFFHKISFRKLETAKLPVVYTTIFIFILWAAEFIYEGGIPLLKILLHRPYNYRLFGIPSLHVFVVTFSSFFTV